MSHLVRGEFEAVGATEPYRRGSSTCSVGRGLARVGAHPRASSRKRACTESVAALVGRRGRRERDRAQVGRGRASEGGRFSSDSRSRRSPSSSCARSRRRSGRLRRSGECLPARSTRAGSSSSTSRPARRRSRSSQRSDKRPGLGRARRDARPVRDRPAPSPVWSGDEAPGPVRRPAEALLDRDRPQGAHHDRRPRGRRVDEHDPPDAADLEAALDGLRGAVELPIPAVRR